jgi:zinc and cadmium transporter
MELLFYILIFTFVGSIASLLGGVILLTKKNLAGRISHLLSAFAAGALLGTAFLDLLPEGVREAEHLLEETGTEINIFAWTLAGFLAFFILERGIHWSHHHQVKEGEFSRKTPKAVVPLIIIGDSVHNFLDGVIIASTFLVSVPLGIMTSLAVAAHEIPQEIGDFGILLHNGIKKAKILWLNVLSASISLLGALSVFWMGEAVEAVVPVFLSLAAGFFIYIASADLIPEIHNQEKRSIALTETLLLILGVVVVWMSITFLEGFIIH